MDHTRSVLACAAPQGEPKVMDSDDELPPDLVEVREDETANNDTHPSSCPAPAPLPSASTINTTSTTDPLRPTLKTPRLIPTTLLTGYLGSGKTTLLQYILNENHGYRVAVCMNDFSDTTDIEQTSLSFTDPSPLPAKPPTSSNPNIEPTSPPTTTQTQTQPQPQPQTRFLSLPNGCLCCSIKEPGIAAIENMIIELESEDAQDADSDSISGGEASPQSSSTSTSTAPSTQPETRPKSRTRPIDWLLIELTGIADPTVIAKTFWQNEEMGGRLKLDGIVGVVDCGFVGEQLRERAIPGEANECQKQIAASDVILLNKTDLVSEVEVEKVQGMIQQINPTAIFKRTHRSQVPLGEIFCLGSYSAGTDREQGEGDARIMQVIRDASVSSGLRAEQHRTTQEGDGHVHDHAPHEGSSHISDISSVIIDLPILSQARFAEVERFLQGVHWDSQPPGSISGSGSSEVSPTDVGSGLGFQVLRSKGVMYLEDGSTHILQGVRDLFEVTPLVGKGDEAGGKKGKLVFIGRGLPEVEVWRDALGI